MRPARAARGRTATLRYRVADGGPCGGSATVAVKVKNRAGRVAKTLKPVVKPVNTALTWRFTAPRTWKVGRTYRFYVYATDTAGIRQAKVASNRVIVR